MAEFNPMNLASALSKISGAFGGAGEVWKGTQSGLVNRAIQKYSKSQAESATKLGSKMGMMNLLGKGASLLTMMYAPWKLPARLVAGALVGGGVSGIGQKYFADQLSREDVAKYMPEGQRPLYGLDEASEIESTAHSAIDKLQASVVPTAMETAITTPLQYMTYKMSQTNPYLTGKAGSDFIVEDMKSRFAPKSGGVGNFLFGEADNLVGTPNTLKDYLNILQKYKQ